MSPLAGHLRARIAKQGPLTVQQFMEEALGHPEFGYYMTRDPFGAHGDFTTAPEISQIFGELVGAWLANAWQVMGAPSLIHLIELGPGRGTLMKDVLRACRHLSGFHKAVRVGLVETSPALRACQRETLADTGVDRISWYRDLSQIAAGPSLIVANEFFDAMPVRQFVMRSGNWCERLVDADGRGLVFTLSDEPARSHFLPGDMADRSVADGCVIETSPPGLRVMHTLAARLAGQGGAGLIIDYGHTASAVGETLQAVRGHAYADVLDRPGEQDLTAHVDFAALSRVADDAGAEVDGPVTQAAFLSRMGIDIRLQRLLSATDDEAVADGLMSGAQRLMAPQAMGSLFRVLGLRSPMLSALPGFDG